MERRHPHYSLSEQSLATLKQRALALAESTKSLGALADQEQRHQEAYLSVRYMDERYGLPLVTISEVISVVDVVHLPGAPQHVIGLTRLRGKALALINLRAFWRGGVQGHADSDHAVVVEVEHVSFGVLCTAVEGLLDLSMADIVAVPSDVPQAIRDCVRGMADRDLLLIDPARLIAQPGFVVR